MEFRHFLFIFAHRLITMKPKILNLLPSSLSARLSLWVVLFVAMLFLATFSLMFYYAREAVRNEAVGKAEDILERLEVTIRNTINEKEVAARQMYLNVERNLNNPAKIDEYLQEILRNEPEIIGVAAAFEPGYYADKQGEYMIYYYRHGRKILKSNQFAGESYMHQPWYEQTKETGKAYWSHPVENYKTNNEPIVSFGMPLKDGDKIVGVFAIDISLYWLTRVVMEKRPTPTTFGAMATRKGAFLIHPDTTLLKPRAMFTLMEQYGGEQYSFLAYKMLRGETGAMTVDFNGQKSYIAYKPLAGSSCVIDVVCPEEEIMGNYNNLILLMALVVVLALLMISAFLFFFIHRELVPLRILETSAKQMTKGDYFAPVSISGRQDEVGSLTNSFVAMRRSIRKHLDEIDRNREMLDEQNRTLKEAQEHAKEADRVKAAFLQNMTDQMSEPATDIANIVAELGQNKDKLNREQVAKLASRMEANTKAMTTLLDRMLDVSIKKEEGGL